jgi:O-antigen/teichoic acid export membrane protein
LVSKIINTFGTRTATAILNLLIAIVISQFLGAAGKGSQGLIVTTIAFILVFSNIVGGATLVYLTPRYPVSALLLPACLWTLLTGIASFVFLSFIPLVEGKFILDICLLSVLNSFMTINSSLLIGKEKISSSNLVNLLVPLTTIILLIIFLAGLEERDIRAYIISLYAAYGLAYLASIIYVRRFIGRVTKVSVKVLRSVIGDLFKLGFLNQIAHITQMMSFRLSYYLLDFFHSEAAVGVYSNAISITESIWLISKSISLVQYSSIANTNDRGYASRITIRLIKAAVVISAILLLPLLILPVSFYTFVFGDGFEGIKPVIWFLAPGVLLYNISILSGHYFSGLGKYNVNAIVSSIGLAVSVAVYYLFIPGMKENGAGLATSISYSFTSILLFILFIRHGTVKASMLAPSLEDYKYIRDEMGRLISKQKNKK